MSHQEAESKRRKVVCSSNNISNNNEGCVFSRLVKWMRARDSEVSDFLCFREETRELYVESHIQEGSILMKLSKHVVISRQYLVPKLFREIAQESSKQRKINNGGFEQHVEHEEDITLALYLASEAEEIKPYLDILPSSIDQNLPISWTREERAQRLRGSPVLAKIEEVEKRLTEDYSAVSTFLSANTDLARIPSKEAFSNALAWVRSRAFGMEGAIKTDDGDAVPAMMPLLDLCNHARGKIVSKNLSYSYHEGWVVVKAVKDLCPGEVLRITYGALPNSQLLLNYGFCLDENIEPDGSSNDTLDFQPIPGRPPVIHLQTGPKSYAYGKLVRALECFFPEEDHNSEASASENGKEDDLHRFLDECDEQDDSLLYPGCLPDAGSFAEDGHSADNDDISTEKEALRKLETRLLDLLHSYDLEKTDNDLTPASATRQRAMCIQEQFASILIRSEVRTLNFYLEAVRRVISKLGAKPKGSQHDTCTYNAMDHQTTNEQIEELVDVYMRIRHPNLSTL